MLEAITLKKFIISTNCPTGPREILINGQGGELVRVEDYKGLAKKILFFNSNKKKLNKKINIAHKALKRFDYTPNFLEHKVPIWVWSNRTKNKNVIILV